MNAVLGGIVRTLLVAVASYASGKGIDINGIVSPEAQAAVVTLLVAIWSVYQKIRAGKPKTIPE